MKHQYYLPDDDAGKVLWINAFAEKVDVYAATLGIAAGTVTAVQNDAEYFSNVVTTLSGFRDYFQAITAYKNALRDGSPTPIGGFPVPPVAPTATAVTAGIFKRMADLVQTIKSNPAYNQTIGEAMGIIGAEINPDFDTIQPQPKVSLKNGKAYVKWKREHTDAVDVYADHGDAAGFTLVARILKTSYLDPQLPAAGQTKIYKYKLRYVVNDAQVGVESDPVSITVTGV